MLRAIPMTVARPKPDGSNRRAAGHGGRRRQGDALVREVTGERLAGPVQDRGRDHEGAAIPSGPSSHFWAGIA